jgi:predicted O-methyltransferase YrrM
LGGDCGKMKIAVCCPYLLDSLVEQQVQDLIDRDIEIHLWALQSVLPRVAQFTRGTGQLGKAQALNRLLPYASNADLVLFIDDDVRLGPRFISTYLSIVTALGASVAQPALTANSHYSHSITLQRPGRWARLTNFVESGPVVSMTREFLDLVTPFPESSRMGWGLDVQWSAIAQAHGFRMAIVDACPVEHTFRPVGAHYDRAEAWKDMERFLAEHRLTWPCHRVLREYPRICERPSEYLAAFPAPAEAVQHGLHSDAALDLPLLWAVASLVQPELIVELGTRRGMSTRTLVHAARRWGGRVITVDPVEAKPYLADVPCEFVQKTGEDLFCTWSTPVKFLFIDTDPHSYQQTRHWLDTWVKTWLADGGVAVIHDVVTTRPEVQVAQAVRDWLREQPPIWHWQEFAGTSGLGLLWRVGDRPDFEGLLAGSTGQVPHPEKNQREGVRQGAAAVTRPRGQLRASIVIASLNEGDRLWKTVQSCIETVEELDGSYEVVIADDASDDSSIEALRQRFPHIRVFAHAERRGVSPTQGSGGAQLLRRGARVSRRPLQTGARSHRPADRGRGGFRRPGHRDPARRCLGRGAVAKQHGTSGTRLPHGPGKVRCQLDWTGANGGVLRVGWTPFLRIARAHRLLRCHEPGPLRTALGIRSRHARLRCRGH